MGIHGLAKLIADQAPSAIKEQDIKNYFGYYYYYHHILKCRFSSKVFLTLRLNALFKNRF